MKISKIDNVSAEITKTVERKEIVNISQLKSKRDILTNQKKSIIAKIAEIDEIISECGKIGIENNK